MKNFRTLAIYIREYKWQFLGGLVALIIVNLAQLYIPRIIKHAVDDISSGTVGQGDLVRYALYIVGLALSVAFFRFFWRYYIFGAVRSIEKKLRNRLFSHLQSLDIKFFQKRKVGELMAHSTNDIEAVRRTLAMGTIMSVDIAVLGILSLVFMLFISVKLTLFAIIPLPLLSLVVLRFAKLIHRRFELVQESFASLTAHARESIGGIRVVKGYNQEEGEIREFGRKAQHYVDKNIDLLRVWSAFRPLIFFFASMSQCILLWLGGREAILRHISMGDFVAFLSYLGMLIWPVIGIGMLVNIIQRGSVSMGRINKLLETAPEIESRKANDIDVQGRIEFADLSFSYNGAHTLRDINLDITAGESIGLVGQIGSGKSTLVSLIPRLFEPTTGRISLDDVLVQDIPLSILRKNVNLVPQDTFLFSETIRANIAFGRPDADDSEIHRTAKLASVYDEIMEFSEGFDEMVGERGVTLSGGQRQRVAIARAILRNPKVLILDNALSSVDVEKEISIIRDVRQEFADRTLIIISHRMRSIANLDRIVVMEDGAIAETGTHKELMDTKGVYYNLFKSQEI
jgi:ATP-binding cassette subfamily B protein